MALRLKEVEVEVDGDGTIGTPRYHLRMNEAPENQLIDLALALQARNSHSLEKIIIPILGIHHPIVVNFILSLLTFHPEIHFIPTHPSSLINPCVHHLRNRPHGSLHQHTPPDNLNSHKPSEPNQIPLRFLIRRRRILRVHRCSLDTSR